LRPRTRRAAHTSPMKLLRNRVESTAAVGMTARQPAQRQPASAQRAVKFDRLLRVTGTSWPVATRSTDPRRQQQAVDADQRDQQLPRKMGNVHFVLSAAACSARRSCNRRSKASASSRSARFAWPRGVESCGAEAPSGEAGCRYRHAQSRRDAARCDARPRAGCA